MGLAEFIASLPTITERSTRSRILVVGYALRSEGKPEFSARDLAAGFLSARIGSPKGLANTLKELSRGSQAPLVLLDGPRFALSVDGVREVEDWLDSVAGIRPARKSLEVLVSRITDPAEKLFLAEAIACVQVNAKRAAVTMCWLLTVSHLQTFVLSHHLPAFNTALSQRTDCKGITIANRDDFAEIKKESTFIELLRSSNVVTNDVRKLLDVHLGFRNTCAHPSTVEIPETKVIAAIEDLVNNVVLKCPA